MKNYAELLFIDGVRDLQDAEGMGEKFASIYPGRTQEGFSASDEQFIAERESFYIASVSPTGWPYVQHRGGPKGFLKILSPTRIGFADYRGNRQFITMGHASRNDRVALILMDYLNRSRLKLLGHLTMAKVEDAEEGLLARLTTPGEGKVERVATIDVEAIDWNCPQYIPRLVGMEHLQILEKENEVLKEEIQRLRNA